MSKADKFLEEKIKKISREGGIVYDIGGASRFQKGLAKYKPYFANCNYKTVDLDAETNPDILADAHSMPIESESADAVICNSVLEHAYDPARVVSEIYRILKPNGKCLAYVPFIYPYHGGGSNGDHYAKDYWRFSRDGVGFLLRNFRQIEICETRGHFESIANLIPYSGIFPVTIITRVARLFDILFSRFQSGNQSSGYNIFCVK